MVASTYCPRTGVAETGGLQEFEASLGCMMRSCLHLDLSFHPIPGCLCSSGLAECPPLLFAFPLDEHSGTISLRGSATCHGSRPLLLLGSLFLTGPGTRRSPSGLQFVPGHVGSSTGRAGSAQCLCSTHPTCWCCPWYSSELTLPTSGREVVMVTELGTEDQEAAAVRGISRRKRGAEGWMDTKPRGPRGSGQEESL